MHSFWFFFLRKREFSWLLIIVLIALGIYTLMAIPKESAPEVIVPIGIVTTFYPGAAAPDVEDLITRKLESAIENVDDLKKITSVSRDGLSSVTAEFNASADIDKALTDLRDAVDSAKSELPRDAEDPIVTEVNFADQPIFVISVSSDATPKDFTQLSEDLESELKEVYGVSKIVIGGVEPRQMQVVIEPDKLVLYNLNVSDVITALAIQNTGYPVGSITAADVEYNVRLEGALLSASDLEAVTIGANTAGPIYLRDIATVVDTVGSANNLARVSVNGQPSEKALTLSIYKKAGVNVTTMSQAVNEKLAALQATGGLLQSSQVLVIFDQGADTKEQLGELVRAGTETVILVMISLLLTIGWRESLIAGLSIPLSFVIAFIGLYASGNTINFISLFALILAVGILVDSGIVMTEAIHTRQKRSGNALQAAFETIKEYAWPLIAGTMTTVAVFAPLFFLSGVVGQFIASIPFTIIFVLLASIVVALGMVPLLAIKLASNNESNRFEAWQEAYTHKAQEWYRRKLIAFLENRKRQRVFLWLLFAAFVLSLLLPVSGLLKVVFFPPEDVDFIYIDIEAKEGTPLYQTDLSLRLIEEILYTDGNIKSFSSTAGASSNFTGSNSAGARFANITVELVPERTTSSAEYVSALRAKLLTVPGVKISILEQQNGPSSGAPIVIKFIGEDLKALGLSAESAVQILRDIKGVRDIENSSDSSNAEFVLTIDNAKASQAGINPSSIGTTLRATVYGVTATTLRRNGTDVDVIVRLGDANKLLAFNTLPEITLDNIRNTVVTNMKGESILLGTILNENYASANTAIFHDDKERVVTVSAYTTPDTTASEVIAAFKSKESELVKDTSVRLAYGGETEDINQSFTEMFLALIAGLLLMLGILVLSFNSVRYSLYLLLAVPYSLIGVFIGLTITGLALSFTSLLGVIALAGVIINHAIILMDSLITAKASISVKEATLSEQVAAASVSRFRPIMLTTITTVVGMVPLSRISDFWSPLAFAIMFGLSFAMVLTLVLIPTLFYRHEQKRQMGNNG